jgi:rfaE bifunctional protein kinase chain/domain/rfaE bifunctional protein nucleotidyltransferase chain/domain
MKNMESNEFRERYGHKIVDINFLVKKYPLSRDEKIVLCNGVFDIVHPGHVRHLVYAKNKGDKLIVSLTADGFITKGTYRPHIPQNVRALNLAAFEMVDYVLIDEFPTPIETISKLKPDFFAKGYEYGNLHNEKTSIEKDLLDSYGGKIIFTPGDVVYSSSAIIESDQKNLEHLNLAMQLEAENISIDHVIDLISRKHQLNFLILGDTIVDVIEVCTSIGGQTKTPTISIRHDKTKRFLGGAAIVAAHLSATGSHVKFLTVCGDDEPSNFVENELQKNNVETLLFRDNTRPTTVKKVFTADGYRLLKVDTVDNRPVNDEVLRKIAKKLEESNYDGIIFSDFRHGLFTKESILNFKSVIPSSAIKIADSQVASRWGNIIDFQDFDLITPNEKEARFSIGDQESTVINLALEIVKQTNCKNLILKLGKRGSIALDSESSQSQGIFSVPSLTNLVIDPVGAGDALIAYASFCLGIGLDVKIANLVGAIAASIACEKEGNIPIKLEEVIARLNQLK